MRPQPRPRRPGPRALGALLAAALALTPACGDAPERPVRVVLVSLDTLRLDALLGTEDAPSAMPRTRAWARRGMTFDRYYAATTTTQPSHASMFTGLQPWEHGVLANGMVLDDGHETLAERFRSAGFHTGAVVASFPCTARFGFGQGFDEFEEELSIGASSAATEDEEAAGHSLANDVAEAALALLDRSGNGDQFLWFHFFDAHGPYGDTLNPSSAFVPEVIVEQIVEHGRAPSRILARARELYRTDARFLDSELARVLARLDTDAARFDTHVVLVADHGENLGEAGAVGHGKILTDVTLRVPFVVVSPRVTPGESGEPVASVDLPATLLALAGLPGRLGEGRDVFSERPPELVFGMRRTYARPTQWRYLDGRPMDLTHPVFYAGDEAALYVGDGTAVDAVEGDPPSSALAAHLRARFAAFATALRSVETEALDDAHTERQLRALGYTR